MRNFGYRMRSIAAATTISVTMALAPISIAAGIPDDVDVSKYESIYQSAKAHSDQKRAAADRIDSEVQVVVGQIADLENRVANDQSQIYENDREIRSLQNAITDMEDENRQLNNLIRENEQTIVDNRNRLNSLDSDIRSEENTLVSLRQRRDEIKARKDNIAKRLDAARRDLQN